MPQIIIKDLLFCISFIKVFDFIDKLDVDIDNFLIKLLTMSLEVHYIPIKKVTILYTKILSNIFSYQSTNSKNQILIHPVIIFNDSAIQSLPE